MLLLRLILLYLFDQSSCVFSSLHLVWFLKFCFWQEDRDSFLAKYSSWVGLGWVRHLDRKPNICARKKSTPPLKSVARCQVTSCNFRCQTSFTIWSPKWGHNSLLICYRLKEKAALQRPVLYNSSFLLYYHKKYMNTTLPVCLALSQVALHSKPGSLILWKSKKLPNGRFPSNPK